MNIDMILCDLLLSPINGLLLRWVWMQQESANRFIPFIMISGTAKKEYVEAARDLGVTEFVAKSFSARSILGLVMKGSDNPRQFITYASCLDPDRRRKAGKPPGDQGAPPSSTSPTRW